MNYYNQNSKKYYEDTLKADVSELYIPFFANLCDEANILDAGCGSGRDSLEFIKKGYNVSSMDESEEMVKLASELLNKKVLVRRFQDIACKNSFDGIWACASLLHVLEKELVDVFIRLTGALKEGGVIQASFKYGSGERKKGTRIFLDMNEKDIDKIILEVANLKIMKTWITNDVRVGREQEKWLNILLKKDTQRKI